MFSIRAAPLCIDGFDGEALIHPKKGSWPFGVGVSGVALDDTVFHPQRPSKLIVELSPTFKLFGQPLTAAFCPMSELSKITLDT